MLGAPMAVTLKADPAYSDRWFVSEAKMKKSQIGAQFLDKPNAELTVYWAALAISMSLHAAASGSAKGRESMNFMLQPLGPLLRRRAPPSSTHHPAKAFSAPSLRPTARSQTSRSSSVIGITGIAFGWIGSTIAFGTVQEPGHEASCEL